MDLSETLIIVLILLLVFGCMNYTSAKSKYVVEATKDVLVDNNQQLAEAVGQLSAKVNSLNKKQENNSSENAEQAENQAMMDNIESFSVCAGVDNETDRAVDCLCGDSPDITFAVHEFGAPGMDYKSFMASQEVDPEVLKNHTAFVEERSGFTGRTFTPDSHDSYDPIPWVGLRRPEYVKQCNPTQVPDVDVNLYKGNRQFCFKT